MGFVCSTALASVTSLSPYSFDRSAEVDAIMIMIMIRMIMMVIRNTMMAVERNYDLAENVVKFTLGGGEGGIPSKLEFHHSSKTAHHPPPKKYTRPHPTKADFWFCLIERMPDQKEFCNNKKTSVNK